MNIRITIGGVIVGAYTILVAALLVAGIGLLIQGYINPVPAWQINAAISHHIRELLGWALVGVGALAAVHLWWASKLPRRNGVTPR